MQEFGVIVFSDHAEFLQASHGQVSCSRDAWSSPLFIAISLPVHMAQDFQHVLF